VKLFHVDAFASRPFEGNPAAVCLLDRERPEAWMQSVAAEMNLSETAFLLPRDDVFGLRWFTPEAEVPLCGHATLASAHALWESGVLSEDREALFDTRSGRLTARRVDGRVEIDLPAAPLAACALPEGAAQALGVSPVFAGRTPDRGLGDVDYVVEVASEAEVRGLRPDFARLRALRAGFAVTARADGPPYDFVSRYFASFVGIDEDPVTGAAHCALVPHWSGRLGKDRLTAYQASARGGVVRGLLEGDRVRLAGEAVTVARGEIAVRE
jgi:PhzF family phenazine biosynthesis protein